MLLCGRKLFQPLEIATDDEAMGPPLTTLSVFPHEIGRQAAEMLLGLINGTNGKQQVIQRTVQHRLIERESVRQLSAAAPVWPQ